MSYNVPADAALQGEKKWLNEKVLSAKTTKSEEMFLDVSISVNPNYTKLSNLWFEWLLQHGKNQ